MEPTQPTQPTQAAQATPPLTSTPSERSYAMSMHITQFASIVIPFAGWLVPLIMWLVKREESAFVNAQGKVIFNWILSSLIYYVGSFILMFILIGWLTLIALVICNIVFIIIGAIRANEGIVWQYPLSIPFFK